METTIGFALAVLFGIGGLALAVLLGCVIYREGNEGVEKPAAALTVQNDAEPA